MYLTSFWCYGCNNPFELDDDEDLKCSLCQSDFVEEIPGPQANQFAEFLDDFMREPNRRTTRISSAGMTTTTTTRRNSDGSVTTFITTTNARPEDSETEGGQTASQESGATGPATASDFLNNDMFRSMLAEMSTGMNENRRNSINPFNNLIRRLMRLNLDDVIINGMRREDIPRAATEQFVNNLTETTLTETDLDKYKDKKCVICLVEYEKDNKVSELKCKHEFHSECIKQWLTKSGKCPVCRQDAED